MLRAELGRRDGQLEEFPEWCGISEPEDGDANPPSGVSGQYQGLLVPSSLLWSFPSIQSPESHRERKG